MHLLNEAAAVLLLLLLLLSMVVVMLAITVTVLMNNGNAWRGIHVQPCWQPSLFMLRLRCIDDVISSNCTPFEGSRAVWKSTPPRVGAVKGSRVHGNVGASLGHVGSATSGGT